MTRRVWTRRAAWLGSLAAAVLLSSVAAYADGPAKDRPQPRLKIFRSGPGTIIEGLPAERFDFTTPLTTAAEPVKLSDYWIGVHLAPEIPEILRAHLDLPQGQGLLVSEVVPDGPAAEAGIKAHDILLKAGDKPLDSVKDLIAVIDETKDGKFTVELLRGGKKQKVTVTPVKRPEDLAGIPGQPLSPMGPGEREVWKWLERLQPDNEGRRAWQFHRWGPGMIVPPSEPMPDNMAVTITKEGDKPAKITVKRGDKTWEVTENELDKLPDDVRPHIERMLGRIPGVKVPGAETFELPEFDIEVLPPRVGRGPWRLPRDPAADKAFEDLRRQIDELRKSIEEMRRRDFPGQRRKPTPRDQKPPLKKAPSEKVL